MECRICGGTLVLEKPQVRTIGYCPYCKSRQALTSITESGQVGLLERAERFQKNYDFENARNTLNTLVTNGQADAEVHWLLALCRYEIIYVEDPETKRNLPTFLRINRTPFSEDVDCNRAIEISERYGEETQNLYRQQAKEICRVQERIIAAIDNGSKYDVFICYKETDPDGNRTEDSVIANKIYNALNREHINVFFSRITLRDRIGEDYEATIHSALMSAKIMLLVMSCTEYAESPWVKSEWKRFDALANQNPNENRRLVPVLCGARPEDIPNDLAQRRYQALDYTKLGAEEDLVASVQRALVQRHPVANEDLTSIHNAFISLTNKKYDQAQLLCNNLIVQNERNNRAHFCLFAAEKHLAVSSESSLVDFYSNLINETRNHDTTDPQLKELIETFISHRSNSHFKKAYEYGDSNYKNMLDNVFSDIDVLWLKRISERANIATTSADYAFTADLYDYFSWNHEAMQEKEELTKKKNQQQYDDLKIRAARTKTLNGCIELANQFSALNFKDSSVQAEALRAKGCQIGYLDAISALSEHTEAADKRAVTLLESLAKYDYKDSAKLLKKKTSKNQEELIKKAMEYTKTSPTPDGYRKAADMLRSIDTKRAKTLIKRFETCAIKAARKSDGIFSTIHTVYKVVSVLCTIITLVFTVVWFALTFAGYADNVVKNIIEELPNALQTHAPFVLLTMVIGVAYGFIIRFCKRKGWLTLLFIAALIFFAAHFCYGFSNYPVVVDVQSMAASLNIPVENTPWTSTLISVIPSMLFMLFLSRAKRATMHKTLGWVIGLCVLISLVALINWGILRSKLQMYHSHLSGLSQILFFPAVTLSGALCFGLWRRFTKAGHLLDFLYVVSIYSIVFHGPYLSWKLFAYNNSLQMRQLFLAVLLLPSIAAFFIPNRKA